VSNGSPHNLFGQYTRMRVGKIRLSIQHQLSEIPTDQWSTEPLSGWRNGGPTVVLPPLEADLEVDGAWRLPLLPATVSHSLKEWAALRPLARALVGRCLLISYTSTTVQITFEGVPWDPCRLQLAAMAGIRPCDLREFFRTSQATRSLREQ
jgi:hypothetical protein